MDSSGRLRVSGRFWQASVWLLRPFGGKHCDMDFVDRIAEPNDQLSDDPDGTIYLLMASWLTAD